MCRIHVIRLACGHTIRCRYSTCLGTVPYPSRKKINRVACKAHTYLTIRSAAVCTSGICATTLPQAPGQLLQFWNRIAVKMDPDRLFKEKFSDEMRVNAVQSYLDPKLARYRKPQPSVAQMKKGSSLRFEFEVAGAQPISSRSESEGSDPLGAELKVEVLPIRTLVRRDVQLRSEVKAEAQATIPLPESSGQLRVGEQAQGAVVDLVELFRQFCGVRRTSASSHRTLFPHEVI